jgi:hypothetical protein
MKSLEVYTEQTKTMLGSADSSRMTMFHQMLSYLMLQEEMQNAAEKANGAQFWPKFHSEGEIQQMVFDEDYLDYLRSK